MIEQIVNNARQKMEQIIVALREQLMSLHVGRATSAMVENIDVEFYGSRMPLKQMASIAIPESNQVVITPWDKGAFSAIESAIRSSDLNVNPINDGKAIRIVLPPPTEERRRELVKVVGKMSEEARIAIRNNRRDAWESVQNLEKDGKVTEDDRDRVRGELDKLIDKMNQAISEIAAQKEKEIESI